MEWAQVASNAALLFAVAIFVGLFAFLIREIRPFKNFERGVAALLWSFPLSVLATKILVYLDTPYIFLSLDLAYEGISNRIGGIRPSPLGLEWNIEEWYVR